MNGIKNENQLTIVGNYEINKPLNHKRDSIVDNCYRGCHNKNYHTFENKCEYDVQLTNIIKNEIINLTISGKSINLYEINEKGNSCRTKWFYI